jgi:WD40 repeat protein
MVAAILVFVVPSPQPSTPVPTEIPTNTVLPIPTDTPRLIEIQEPIDTVTPTITPIVIPIGGGSSESNYQQFSPLFNWEVGNDVIKITGVAISYKTQQIALLVQRYAEGYALELRDIEGKLKWVVSLVKAAYPAIAFSPDGSLIATGTDDGNVRIWRSSDGSLVHDLIGHRFPVRIVAFSPDGMMVASGGSDNTARLWMVAGGMSRKVYDNKTDVRDIAFSSDSHYLAVSANIVVVLDTTTNESIGNMQFYDSQGDTQELGEVAFSSDGKRIAASGNWFNVENGRWRPRIMVWDFPTGVSSATRIPIDDAFEDLVFSEDGNLIMGVLKDRGKLQIYSIADREVFGEIDIGSMLLMSYSPDLQMFAVASTKTTVTVWGIAP